MHMLMTDTVNMTDSNDIIIILIILIEITALSFLKNDCHCNLNASLQLFASDHEKVHCNKRDHEARRREAEAVVSRGRGRGHCHRGQGRGRGQFFRPRGRGQSKDLTSLVKCNQNLSTNNVQ